MYTYSITCVDTLLCAGLGNNDKVPTLNGDYKHVWANICCQLARANTMLGTEHGLSLSLFF